MKSDRMNGVLEEYEGPTSQIPSRLCPLKKQEKVPTPFLGKTLSLYSERWGEKWATSMGCFSGNNITFFSNLAVPRLLVISASLEGERITASTCTQLYDWVAGKMLCPVVLQALSASKEGRTKRVF